MLFCSRCRRRDIFYHQELLEGVCASLNLVLPPFPFSGETEAQWIEGPSSVFPSWSQDSLGEEDPAICRLDSCLLLISLFSVIDVTDSLSPRDACGKSFLELGGAWCRIVAGLWGWMGLDQPGSAVLHLWDDALMLPLSEAQFPPP